MILDPEGLPAGVSSIEALETAIAHGDFDAAVEIVCESWFELLQVHGGRVRAALGPLTQAELRGHPLLTMLLSVSYLLGGFRRTKALQLFASAVRASRPLLRAARPAERVLILSSEAVGYRLVGRHAMGLEPARSAIDLLESIPDGERERIAHLPHVYAQLGVSLYYGGEVEQALTVFERGLAESADTAPAPGFGNVAMLAGIHAVRGDLHEAEHFVRIAKSDVWNDTQRSTCPGTLYRVAEAMLALEQFDVATAERHLDAMVHDRRTIEHWVAIAHVEALTGLVAGRPGAALARLDAFVLSRGAAGRSPAQRRAFAPLRALLTLAAGSPEAAGPLLRRDEASEPQRHLDLARVELALGRTGIALTELRIAAEGELSSRSRAEAAALEAAVALRISSSRANAAIERLAGTLEHTGQRLAVALLPADDIARVHAALDAAGHAYLYAETGIPRLILGAETGKLLTARELDVLRALMRSSALSMIAGELAVSVNTVKTQLKSIYRKLGAANREEAVSIALDRHLVSRDD